MTPSSESSWQIMAVMSLLLGVRHGFDLDHIATIDAITSSSKEKSFSRWSGCLFSLGHGIVITLISIVIGVGLFKGSIPSWLQGLGTAISLFFLSLFGLLGLYNIFFSKKEGASHHGIKSLIAKKITAKTNSTSSTILIGALFALSFDTISQVALFSLSASILSGWKLSLLLGTLFTIGMMVSDGVNGFVISYVIQRAKQSSMILSKGLGALISLFSLIIAAITILNMLRQ